MMHVITQQSYQVHQRLVNDASKSSRVKVLVTTLNLCQKHGSDVNSPYLILPQVFVFHRDWQLCFFKRGHK